MKTTRTIAVQPVRVVDARINITPLIDVVLVLLILFMVITPTAEQELTVQLAAEKRTALPSEVDTHQIVVAVAGDGALRINDEVVAQADYFVRLRGLLLRRSPASRVVFVIAADDARYADVVAAIDRAKQAGASRIGFAADAER